MKSTPYRACLLALSGNVSSGKSTQRELLLEHLRAHGIEPVTIWSRPGYSKRMRAAKRLLRALTGRKAKPRRSEAVASKPGRYPRRAETLTNPLVRWSWLTVALLDLLWTHAVQMRWWRARGRTVLSDRHLLDALVDFRVHFPDDRVEERWLCRRLRALAVRPDVALCLLVPAEESLRRTRQRQRHNWETLEVLERRERTYREVAGELRIPVVDGRKPIPEIAALLQGAWSQHAEPAGPGLRASGS